MAARAARGNASAGHPDGTPGTADPIDWARHFWRRHGLGEDEDAFVAMSSVLRFYRLMVDRLDSELRTLGLNLTDYMLLMTLQLSEKGSRLISQLARSLLIHATTATLACDRLENRGLIERGAHPTDRRATLVLITPEGRELVGQATSRLRSVQFGLVGSTVAGQRELAQVVGHLRVAAGDLAGVVPQAVVPEVAEGVVSQTGDLNGA
jgi:DNA-binding MarR family transcriptional regulator